VLAGAADPDAESGSYNADGWYPRPPRGAPVRGMEVVSRALASTVPDLRLGRRVTEIDLDRRVVHTADGDTVVFEDACVSTLPLPATVALCRQAPAGLLRACARLRHNRVSSVALCLEGPRPEKGHWRYYTDESVAFTRLVYMHEFDPLLAPTEGWGLLAEVTEPAEQAPLPAERLIERVWDDVRQVDGAPHATRLVAARSWAVDPAYVVFGLGHEQIASEARGWLAEQGVHMLGRYGRWEYSSMGQVMRDGWALGRRLAAGRDERPRSPSWTH
jgi:protoporphyrinogen oxidase